MSDSGTSIAAIGLALAALATCPLGMAVAQPPSVQSGEVVPRDVRQIYERGLQFLAASQSPDGTWDGGEPGPAMKQGLEKNFYFSFSHPFPSYFGLKCNHNGTF